MSDIVKQMHQQPNFYALHGVSNEDIEQAEQSLGLHFAADYKEYLYAFGVASFDGHELTGICNSKRLDVVHVTNNERRANTSVLREWYVVEQLDIDAITIWQSTDGSIYLLQPGIAPRKIASNLIDYLQL